MESQPSKLQRMHPAWFATGMSTAGTALLLLLNPLKSTSLDEFAGAVLLYLSAMAAVVLSGFGLTRLFRHRSAFNADLHHPQLGPLVAAWPAGLLVLAVAVAQADLTNVAMQSFGAQFAIGLLTIGLLGTLYVGFNFFFWVVTSSEHNLVMMSGTWFIPAVPLVLVPNAIIRLTKLEVIATTIDTFALSLGFWSAGFGLFLLLAAIVGNRLLTLAPPPAHMAATWWIWLAPLGAGGLGLLAIGDLAVELGLFDTPATFLVLASALWSFGLWWIAFVAMLLFRQRNEMHFHLGTWGFGFPSAAFAALTLAIGDRLEISLLQNLATIFATVTFLLWIYLAVRTLQGVASGQVFKRA